MQMSQYARFAVAPMMEWTDPNCRAFHRTLSRHALLYTEMVASAAVVHGDRQRLLGFRDLEHPVACQLGGSDPAQLAEAARIVASSSSLQYEELTASATPRVKIEQVAGKDDKVCATALT